MLILTAFALYAQNKCSPLFAYLEEKGFQPQAQLLTAEGSNNLPYNIIVNFSPEDTKSEHNLILLFDLEQGNTCKEQICSVFDYLQEQNFNSSVVFCYESQLLLPRENIIYGSEIYAHSLNSDGSNYVYIFNLSGEKNAIIPGSNKNHSPSWMLKDMFDAFSSAKITDGLPVCYISQVSDYTFSTDKTLLSFLELDIPCIYAQLKDCEKIDLVLKSCISDFEKSSLRASDTHTFMFRFFGKRIWFSEFGIINAIIVIIVLGFLFVLVWIFLKLQ